VSCLQAVSKNSRCGEDRSPVAQPRREPKALAKTTLEPGQSKQIEFVLTRDTFAYWSPATKHRTVEAGKKSPSRPPFPNATSAPAKPSDGFPIEDCHKPSIVTVAIVEQPPTR